MNTIDYRDTTRVKPATCVSMRVNTYIRVIFMRVKSVSHVFSVELVAGLYCTYKEYLKMRQKLANCYVVGRYVVIKSSHV